MKILKKLFLFIIFLLTLLIGLYIKDDKIYYISLGDEISLGINPNNYESNGYSDYIKEYLEKNKKLKFYTKKFSEQDLRITDLINKIEDNKSIIINEKNLNIKNALNKADLITLSVGFNEILYKYSSNTNNSYLYDYIDECMKDMKTLLKLIKKYNNKTIFVLGYYNPTSDNKLDKYIIYANDKLIKICAEEKVNYVNLYDIFKNNQNLIYNINNSYPNRDGHVLIANKIIDKIKP